MDDDDYPLLIKYTWFYDRGYAARRVHIYLSVMNYASKKFYMHREIMGNPTKINIDHIDHNGLNNQKANLRQCTQQQNSQHMKKKRNVLNRYKGITSHDVRWLAQIRINGKQTYLGIFSTDIEAARAYDAAAKKYHGEFAELNFSD